jgi:hypothetical protein
MLAVSRCWASDHAAIASKSQDTKAAALDEVGGAAARPDHRTSARPKFRTAASPDLIPANPQASSSVRFPLDETADAPDSRHRHLRGQHDDHEIR